MKPLIYQHISSGSEDLSRDDSCPHCGHLIDGLNAATINCVPGRSPFFSCPACGVPLQRYPLGTKSEMWHSDIGDQDQRSMSVFRGGPPGAETAEYLVAVLDELFRADATVEDDRAVAVLGALLVEDAIDEFLGALMPGYKVLSGNRDFTFAIKIETARSLDICTKRFFNDADQIRSVRNEFAHARHVTTFVRAFDNLERRNPPRK